MNQSISLFEAVQAISVEVGRQLIKRSQERQIDVTLIPWQITSSVVFTHLQPDYTDILRDYRTNGTLSSKSMLKIIETVDLCLDMYPMGANVSGN